VKFAAAAILVPRRTLAVGDRARVGEEEERKKKNRKRGWVSVNSFRTGSPSPGRQGKGIDAKERKKRRGSLKKPCWARWRSVHRSRRLGRCQGEKGEDCWRESAGAGRGCSACSPCPRTGGRGGKKKKEGKRDGADGAALVSVVGVGGGDLAVGVAVGDDLRWPEKKLRREDVGAVFPSLPGRARKSGRKRRFVGPALLFPPHFLVSRKEGKKGRPPQRGEKKRHGRACLRAGQANLRRLKSFSTRSNGHGPLRQRRKKKKPFEEK